MLRKLLFLLWLFPSACFAQGWQGIGLEDLRNVNAPVSNLSDNDTIKWDDVNKVWVNTAFPSSTISYINNSVAVGNNTKFNLIPGSGITIVMTNASYGVNATISASAGGGNVSNNGGSTANNFSGFVDTTGQVIKDLGVNNASFAAASHSHSDQGTNTTDDTQFNNLTVDNLFGLNDATVNMQGDFSIRDGGTFWLWFNDTLATGWLTAADNCTQLQIKDSWYVRFNVSDITADTELHFQTKNGTIALLDDVNATIPDQGVNTTDSVGFVAVDSTYINATTGNIDDVEATNANATTFLQGGARVLDTNNATQFVSSASSANITCNNITGYRQGVPFGFTIYNITAANDIPLPEARCNLTLTKVNIMLIGGTNVVGMLEVMTGQGGTPVKVNSTDWTVTPGAGTLNITAFDNATVSTGYRLFWNTSTVSGTPTTLTVSGTYNEGA